MTSEWRECTLGDLGQIITGKTPSTKKPEYWGGTIMFVTPKDIQGSKHIFCTERCITYNGKISVKNSVLPKDAICVSCIGNIGYLGITTEECVSNQQINSIVVNDNNDTDFVYYLLKSLWDYFKNYEGQSTALSILNKTQFSKIKVRIPVIEIQRKIASVLRALDNKIELNNKINDNLAEQSQAILKRYMDSYDYTLTPLGEMAEIIDCLHSKKPNSVSNTTRQLLQLNNITDSGFLDLSKKYYISELDYENWTRKCEIVEGDCVITNVGRIGAVSQAPAGTHAAMGRNMTCIRLKKNNPYYTYLITVLLSTHIRKEIMKNTDEGTIMGALNVKNIPLLLFPVFSNEIMGELENTLYPITKAVEYNHFASQTLDNLRDSLLPKLMSGEFDVPNIQL